MTRPFLARPDLTNALDGRKVRSGALLGLSLLALVGVAGIAEPGADRHRAPMLDVLDEGNLAQPLHHRVVVDDDEGRMLVDRRNRFDEAPGEVEAGGFPIAARQV